MNYTVVICQVLIALVIYNVWLLRFNQATPYRGGSAKNMTEEFLAYGLPLWFMRVVMVLKLSFASLLILGIWMPSLVPWAASGMAALMLGAVVMHAKVHDSLKKTAPAATMLGLSLFVMLASQ